MHREESPDFVIQTADSRRKPPARKHGPRMPETIKAGSASLASDTPAPGALPSLWDAEIDGPHAPNLVTQARGSSVHPDGPESFLALVDPVKPLHRVILEDFRRMADALIQFLRAFKKAIGPRGPDRPRPA